MKISFIGNRSLRFFPGPLWCIWQPLMSKYEIGVKKIITYLKLHICWSYFSVAWVRSRAEVWSDLFVTSCNRVLENKQKSPLHRVKPPCHLIDATASEGGYAGGVRGAVGEWLICLINEPRSNVCSHTWLKFIFAPSVYVITNGAMQTTYNSLAGNHQTGDYFEAKLFTLLYEDIKSAYRIEFTVNVLVRTL